MESAHLENRKLSQALDIVDGIDDPAEKARLYNHIFGSCCPTPQDASDSEEA